MIHLCFMLSLWGAPEVGPRSEEPRAEKPAPAADPETQRELEVTREALRAVYARPEMGKEEVILIWRSNHAPEQAQEEQRPMTAPAWIGTVLAWALGVMGALGVIYLLINLWRRRAIASDDSEAARAPPDTLFGLDLRRSSLPDDIAAAAEEAWRRGAYREALSLLYRGALSMLTQAKRARIPTSATEGECVELVSRQVEQDLAGDFAQLTHQWLLAAYGRQPPSDVMFRHTVQRWRVHWEGGW